mgnify:CR=1 FL=1
MIDKKLLKEIALSESEYLDICELLNREPSSLELGLFGALWSEHCGYKHTKLLLKKLPNKSSKVLSEMGKENAGVLDVGNGIKIVMKVESHNHPSAIEPKEGAATGVGGIVRDIFAMGAYPIAILNSLRFGPQNIPRNKYLLNGVVEGISTYGNCLGIPDVGGEIEFEECYTTNPLVNAMCVGIIENKSPILNAKADKAGDLAILVGSDTGRDGIHGASGLASQSLEEGSDSRSAVQVGNPFLEKVLLESCLISAKMEGIIGMQDLGAAGLTSSVIEVAEKSNLGIELNLDKVHLKENAMTPYEIMLSESQERMLIIVDPVKEERFLKFFKDRDLKANTIGEFIKPKIVKIKYKGNEILNTPVKILTDAPAYELSDKKPRWIDNVQRYIPVKNKISDMNKILESLLKSPNISSKKEVYSQFDHQVQLNTIILPGEADAAVLRLKKDNQAISISIDCDSKKCYLDPEVGASMAVAEACRNIVCTGARPIGLTDGLNMGNPEKMDVQYQITRTIEGLRKACLKFEIPIISGNVSLYNESNEKPIFPTPIIGAIGHIDDYSKVVTASFKSSGDKIIVIGEKLIKDDENLLSGSEYQKIFENKLSGSPYVDLNKEFNLQNSLIEIIDNELINSAHDVSTGGISIAIAESCILGNIGSDILLDGINKKSIYFGENRSAIIVSCNPKKSAEIIKIAKKHNINSKEIGVVTGNKLIINGDICIKVERLKSIFYNQSD